MKHTFTILFLFIASFLFSQNPTFTASIGSNYIKDNRSLRDFEPKDLQDAFAQLSMQLYMSEDLHQVEAFVRYQRGDYKGYRIGVKGHINAIPIITKERVYVRTLLGVGVVYDSFSDVPDIQGEAKLSIRFNNVSIEAGTNIFIMETYYYDAVPEFFFSFGWMF